MWMLQYGLYSMLSIIVVTGWTWFHLMQDVPGATSLLVLEWHSNQPIRFDRQVYSLSQCQQSGFGASTSELHIHI